MERRNEFISTLKQGDCEVTAMKRLKFHKMPAKITFVNYPPPKGSGLVTAQS